MQVQKSFKLAITDELEADKFVTHVLPLNKINESIESTKIGEAIKVVLLPNKNKEENKMAKELTILVACGSGVATSTVAQEAVKVICKGNGIPAKIIKCTISEIASKQDDVDVIMVTTNYRKPVKKPLIKVFGLISGIGRDDIEQEIVKTCKELLE